MVAKSENVTFALVQILNRGEVYEARPEEFKKTEEWLEKAIKGGGFPNAKLSKDGNGQGIHIKVKIDVYNPPWYVLVLSTVNATATIGSLGLVPTYSGRFQHIFYFEVEQPNKSSQTYKVEGPFLAAWWGWLAPLFGNAGGVETQIVESWKLIVQRVAPQIEIKNK
ncbi:hypothetical protein LPTSP4_19420 [Leptospira ryugenii]|uniref:Uncharacterized protein n=2 Tax=Leptospira ryugenii TaxID=1917863 RepID=A0A2P2E0K3_9LEPT|nr:hypothetical protein LPTSP4_19420 [Leptospira ryugenii]